MNNIKIYLKTLSYTLVSCGESRGSVDNDIVYDDVGIPYIPSRRVKGLLRESSLEVCEMLGISTKLVDSIFGVAGFASAKIYIGNLYIINYKEIKKEFKKLQKDRCYKYFIFPEKIISYYTIERYQTAIEKGVAKDGSLRVSRVLKPGIEFEGEILELNSLTEKEKALLYLAAINLRRIGTLRNRGFGEVKCILEGINIEDVSEAIKVLKSEDRILMKEKREVKNDEAEIKEESFGKLVYKVKTLAPVVIASPRGEQNTVYTKTYIPALVVKGLIANQFIKNMDLSNNAHENNLFYNLFLEGRVTFTSAYPVKEERVFEPVPLCLQSEKGSSSEKLYNIFEADNKSKNTKPIRKYIFLVNEKYSSYEPKTTFYFHNSRDREKGHSTDEEIFYYEAIDAEQEFTGEIIGPLDYLLKLTETVGTFKGFIGRSKTAQYGMVEFNINEKIEDIQRIDEIDDEFIIHALSPIIVYNCYGFAEPSEDNLKKYLSKILGCRKEDIDIIDSVVKTERLENFVGVWKLKDEAEMAYSQGSVFKIKINSPVQNLKEKINYIHINGLGEKTHNGYGRVKIYLNLDEEYEKIRERESEEKIKVIQTKELIKSLLQKDFMTWVEYEGFKKAKNFKEKEKISGHLLSKFTNLLLNINNFTDWENELLSFEEKQSGRKLKYVGLWEELILGKDKLISELYKRYGKNEIFNVVNWNRENETIKWEIYKTFWLSFLRNLRLFLKTREEEN